MRRDPRAHLFDVLQAADAIEEFTHGLDASSFAADARLQSAVMYQLMVIGEALNVLAHEDSGLTARIPQHGAAIGMRNRLIHGYQIVDDEIVWATVQQDLPALVAAVKAALADE